jgi:hypothetical protein
MSNQILFWIYLINAVILIIHEIDSAYWQEWKLINPNDQCGINGFLILHIPIIFALLLGLVFVHNGMFAGLIISLVVSLSGIFAFVFHFYHLKKGKPEFNTLLSKIFIIATFAVSILQIGVTVYLLKIIA